MALEALAAMGVALAVLWLVLEPLIRPPLRRPAPFEPVDPEETPKGVALAALKEIEFDRETGKLSDADYDFLKAKYTAGALEALRAEEVSDDIEALIAAKVRLIRSASATTSSDTAAPTCIVCGPRPEADAIFCSSCGVRLSTGTACESCGTALLPESRFCEACGRPVAA